VVKIGFDRVKLNQMMLFGAVRFQSGEFWFTLFLLFAEPNLLAVISILLPAT